MKNKARTKQQSGFTLFELLAGIMLINGPLVGLLSGVGRPELGHSGGIAGALFGLTLGLWISFGAVWSFYSSFSRLRRWHFNYPVCTSIVFLPMMMAFVFAPGVLVAVTTATVVNSQVLPSSVLLIFSLLSLVTTWRFICRLFADARSK